MPCGRVIQAGAASVVFQTTMRVQEDLRCNYNVPPTAYSWHLLDGTCFVHVLNVMAYVNLFCAIIVAVVYTVGFKLRLRVSAASGGAEADDSDPCTHLKDVIHCSSCLLSICGCHISVYD